MTRPIILTQISYQTFSRNFFSHLGVWHRTNMDTVEMRTRAMFTSLLCCSIPWVAEPVNKKLKKIKYIRLRLYYESKKESLKGLRQTMDRLGTDLRERYMKKCFRQTCTRQTDGRTDRQTEIVKPWGPNGAKKNIVLHLNSVIMKVWLVGVKREEVAFIGWQIWFPIPRK